MLSILALTSYLTHLNMESVGSLRANSGMLAKGRAGARHFVDKECHKTLVEQARADRTDPLLDLGGPPMRGVYVVHPWYEITKRVLDMLFCVAALPLALPLMGFCAALIWLEDPGPVIFAQWRTGKQGRRFRMYKFRTMMKDAENLKRRYEHLNELTWPDFKISRDPRVTRMGRVLRRTSLDELPQLLNVLKGEMSLVGPRPTSFDARHYSLPHTERLEVQPGITGLWQISGRSDIDFDERVKLDVEYIRRRSLEFDMRILMKTVASVVLRRGAY